MYVIYKKMKIDYNLNLQKNNDTSYAMNFFVYFPE